MDIMFHRFDSMSQNQMAGIEGIVEIRLIFLDFGGMVGDSEKICIFAE